jgi:hypothetical protein
MWLKGKTAKATYDQIVESSVLLHGDYRWYPLNRITPGESQLFSESETLIWSDARFLKSVADDLSRKPHALEYFYDGSFGSPSLKFFRCIVCESVNGSLRVLGVNQQARLIDIQGPAGAPPPLFNDSGLVSCLVYREPWNDHWTLAAIRPIGIEKALEHLYVWQDFRHELLGDHAPTANLHSLMAANGLRNIAVDKLTFPNSERRLLAVARSIHVLLRGLSNPA